MVRTDTIRLLLALPIQTDLYTAQYDVEMAYFNAPREEELYPKPPPAVSVTPGMVLRLRKTNYGLKESAQAWSEVLKGVLSLRGFRQAEADLALYVNPEKGEFAAAHIDDILFVSKQKSDFGEWLGSHFTFNDLGRPRYLLSIELDRSKSSVSLHQSAYLQRIVSKFLASGFQLHQCPRGRGRPAGR